MKNLMPLKNTSLYLSIIALLSFVIFSSSNLRAQNFEDGLQFYQQQNYQKAVSVFNEIKNPEAYLFTAKSFYAMGNYRQAQSNLNNITSDAVPAIYNETIYTSALIDFQLKQFGDSLDKLYRVFNGEESSRLARDAEILYRQIVNYLTAKQRLEAISQVSSGKIKYDLIESALGKVSYPEAREILNKAQSSIEEDIWNEKVEDIESELSSVSSCRNQYNQSTNKLQPPTGTIYNIGVALPEYQPEAREFEIVRSIYFGALLAAQEFNQQNRNAKAAMRFVDTATSTDSIRSSISQFSETYKGDAIIGPLFSQQAEQMIPLATKLKIPTIAPLANSRIYSENSYLFQSNPTFAMHGKQMAQYAVQELEMDKFAIIAQRGSSGATSAEAFRDEAEKLGAEIVFYFVEDIESTGYEISQYTRRFGSGADPIDAVYAPFTGRAALTLIDLLLVDLRVMKEAPYVLGSQEWQKLNFSSARYHQLNIFFSQGYYLDNNSAKLARFKSDYRNQFNVEPNQFAMIGYDVASYMLGALKKIGNPSLLKSAILNQPLYRGVVNNILFDGSNFNKALKIIEVMEGGELRTISLE